MRRGLSIAVLTVFALLLAFITGAVFSENALQRMVRYAEPHLPLTLGRVTGRLYDGIRVDRFTFDSEAVSVQGTAVVLKPRWACALRSVICLEAITASSLVVTLKGDDGKNAPMAELPNLPEVRIDAFEISALQLRSTNRQEQLQAVAGSDLSLGVEGIAIEGLTFAHEVVQGSAYGEVGPDGRWSLLTDLEVLREMPEVAPGEVLPRQFHAEASGDFASASASFQSLEGMGFASTISIETSDGSFSLSAVIDGLQGVGDHYLANVGYRLADALALELSQSDGHWILMANQKFLDGDQPGAVRLRVSESAQVLALEELRVDFGSLGSMSAAGALGRVDAVAPLLDIRFKRFPLPTLIDRPADTLDGSLAIALTFGDALQWRASNIDLALGGEFAPWKIEGALSSDGNELLPSGGVTLEGLPGRFTYQRANNPAEPAVLALSTPLQLGAMEVSSGVLRVFSDAEDAGEELELSVDGDLKTTLRAKVIRQPDTVEFFLAPFELRIADEVVSMRGPLVGSWHSTARRVDVAPFCLQARASSLCSDGMQLGSSGMAEFALTFDEQIGDEIAGHRYALEIAGTGKLQTNWSDGAWLGAQAAVDLSKLRLDPFEENGTQGTVEFSQATLQATYDGDTLTASLGAASESAGEIDVDFSHSAQGLSGGLRATDFNLRALDDLLPELGLEAGLLTANLDVEGIGRVPQISGQLSISGLSVSVPSALTQLDNGELTLRAMGDGFGVEGDASFGGGSLHLHGTCCDADAITAHVVGTRNRIELQEGLNAVVSSDIDLLIGREQVAVQGDLRVHSGTLEPVIPDKEGVSLSPDIVRVDGVGDQDRRFDLSVALAARVEPGFTLRTKEVEATLSGDLRYVDSSSEPPALYGDLQVLGGELRAYGQTLRLDNGTVGFVGDPLNPTVRLAAEREIRGEDLRVGFRVTGPLEEPVLQIYSEPQRSERETLSYLLRGRGPDAGAGLDATALALSLGATAVNETGLLRSLDSIPGVSGVTLGAQGWDDDMAATLSAYVGERLYLSYGVGIYEPVNALTARLYLQSRLWLEVVSRLENSIDLYYRFDRN
ncbi:MAG: translocation/assembly module TamB domain-containing protein [Pseudomonadota bacterium]